MKLSDFRNTIKIPRQYDAFIFPRHSARVRIFLFFHFLILGHHLKEGRDQFSLIVEQSFSDLRYIPYTDWVVRICRISAAIGLNTVAGGLPEVDGLSPGDGMAGGTYITL